MREEYLSASLRRSVAWTYYRSAMQILACSMNAASVGYFEIELLKLLTAVLLSPKARAILPKM